MKRTALTRTSGLVLAFALSGGAAWAQYDMGPAPALRQPPTAQQMVLDDGSAPLPPEVAAAAPAAVTVAPAPKPEAPAAQPDEWYTAAQTAGNGGGQPCCRCRNEGEPWSLPQPCFLQNLGIKMGGWVQQGITFNADHPADGFNGPVVTNDLDRQYQMNQAWLYFVRPTKTDGCGFDVGGRVDVVYGTDWRFGQSYGLENRFDSPDSFYGLILPQFYAEIAMNDLTVKLGHFATLTSYEVVPAPLNFFYSHTYTMAGYFDPLLVTGVQAEYKLNDNWTAIGGFNRGWEMFEDPSDTLNFLGGVKWASDDKRQNLSVMIDAGKQIGFTGVHERNSCYVVYSLQLTERWLLATQETFGDEEGGSVINPGQDAQWFGTANWLIYKLNPKWSAGLRWEVVRDDDGARIAGIGNVLGTDKGWSGAPGFAGTFTDVSLGLNYRPCPNFVFRPEIRWDWYDGPLNVANQLPFDNGLKAHQFLAAMDMVVTF